MKGTVTISLEDFETLNSNSEVGEKAKRIAKDLDREVSNLLNHMAKTTDMQLIADSYNKIPQGFSKLEITPEGCRLIAKKIKLKVPIANTFQSIKLWNGIYNLTDKEISILAKLIDTEHKEFCSKDHRVKTAEVAGITLGVISTYIKRLKDKKAVVIKDDVYEYSKLFKELDNVEISLYRNTGE